MRRPPRWYDLDLPRDASALVQPISLQNIEAEDPVGELGHCIRVPVQCRGVQEDGRLPRGLLHGLGNVAGNVPRPFVEEGVMPRYQEGVVVLLKDGPEPDGGECPPHYQVHGAAVQRLRIPERMPVIKRILNAAG